MGACVWRQASEFRDTSSSMSSGRSTRRMAWVTWRQHRLALTGVAVLLSALAVLLWASASSCTMPTPPRPPATLQAQLPAVT